MDFLQLIFPFLKLRDSNNLVASIFFFVILLYFTLSSLYFIHKVYWRRKILERLKNHIKQIQKPVRPEFLNELQDKFMKTYEKQSKLCLFSNINLAEAWKDFQDTLVTRNTNDSRKIVYKTEGAEFFFNEDRLIGQYMNLRYWNVVPSLLVGLGILGTFFGLTFGLSGIDFVNLAKIQESIKQLLSGSSIAFVTSVWGMLTSLIFNFIEKHGIGRLNVSIASLQQELNQVFSLTAQEEIQYRQLDELEQQTLALKAFSTDLADGIKAAIDTIISSRLDNLSQQTTQLYELSRQNTQRIVDEVQQLGENIGAHVKDSIINIIQEQLVPALENVSNAVTELKQQKEESSLNAIQQLVERFQNSFSNTTINQLEELSKIVNNAGSSLRDLPNQISTIMASVKEQINETQKILSQSSIIAQEEANRRIFEIEKSFTTLIQSLQNSISEQQDGLVQTISKVSEEAATATDIMREQVENAARSFGNSIKELQQGLSLLLQQQHSQAQAVNLVCDNAKAILEKSEQLVRQMDESLISVEDVIKNTQTLSSRLLDSSQQISNAGQVLSRISAQFAVENEKYLTANRETLRRVQEALNQSQQILSDYSKKFQIIQAGLSDIFSDIQKGLNSYSVTVRETVDNYLAQFSEQLSQAASALSGSVEGLNDSVDNLNDIHETLVDMYKKIIPYTYTNQRK